MSKIWIIIGIVASIIGILFLVNLNIFEEEEIKGADIHKIVQFMEDMKQGKYGEITVVHRYYGGKSYLASNALKEADSLVIYHLKAQYDKKTKESWIEVIPDLSQFKQSADNPVNVISSPEQCGYIYYKQDLERDTGQYMLTECRHRWEYEL
ncbi:hypothetical protein ACH0R4_RS19390 [Bacillus cytotoxicus]|uniref:hypothetical protein n=1 Tax=Bacillus cereus group sp. BfR-BA-01492 TaxID=2920361 RepID=UPI001F55DB2F|nr:hypothetical protein [Bacillus cereus group sp. BfR-BA-01492]EMA6342599.1 hypothetical protein [Bacillus cytotoxicus]